MACSNLVEWPYLTVHYSILPPTTGAKYNGEAKTTGSSPLLMQSVYVYVHTDHNSSLTIHTTREVHC